MAKLYERINWENDPSEKTPLSAENLNKMDKGIDDLDGSIVAIDGRVTNLENAEGIEIDSSLSDVSENPVQNKVIKAALDLKANSSDVPDITDLVKSSDLSAVATSGKYSDLSDLPDVAGIVSRVSSNESALADRYTKAETDGKIAEAMTDVDNEHFHVVDALPGTDIAKNNHEYVLVTYGQDGTTIETEVHYLFYDGEYHQRTTNVSFEGYATEEYVNNSISNVVGTGLGQRITAVEELLDGHSVGVDVPADAKFTDTVYSDTALQGEVNSLKTRVSANETALGGHTVGKDVPSNAIFTDTVYDDSELEGRVASLESASAQAGSEIIPAYIVGEILYRNDWLSMEAGGEPLTPINDNVYAIRSDGVYAGQLFYWDESKKAYRLLGKKNVSPNVNIVQGYSTTRTNILRYDGRTPPNLVNISVKKGDIIKVREFTANVRSGILHIDGVNYGSLSNWEKDYEITQDRNFVIWYESYGNVESWITSTSGYIDHVKAFYDYETPDYIPPTLENPAQSGLVPSVAAGTKDRVLTQDGWDESPLDITGQEIASIFEGTGGIHPNNNVYSTDERIIGVWIDGKPIYRKIINVGNLQSAPGIKMVAHGVQNIDMVVLCMGMFKGTDGYFMTPTFGGWTSTVNAVSVACTNTEVHIGAYENRSAYSGYVEIRYTKTTD